MDCRSFLLPIVFLCSCSSEAPPLFDDAEIAYLNGGGILDATMPKFQGHDEICLFGRNGLKYTPYKGCPKMQGAAIGLLRGNDCEIFSLKGVQARVLSDGYDRECRSTRSDFAMCIFVRHGQRHLVLWDKAEARCNG